jgi:transcriptional regulator with XRE-family HTH domain
MISENKQPYDNVDFFEDLTGEINHQEEKNVEEVGRRIQELREQRGVSIEELSKMTGFSSERLLNIENGSLKPQLGTVMKLSKALDSAFGRILSGEGNCLYSITRHGEQRNVLGSTSRKDGRPLYRYKSLAPDVKGRHMESFIVQLEENSEGDMSVHDGEEFIFVLSGTALFKIGDDVYELAPGDSVYYLSTTPHLIASKEGKTSILAVLYGK